MNSRRDAGLVLVAPLPGLDHEQAELHVGQRSTRRAVHVAVDRALAVAVQAGRVDEDDLAVALRVDAERREAGVAPQARQRVAGLEGVSVCLSKVFFSRGFDCR